MIGRLLAKAFGSEWKLKQLCIDEQRPLLKRIFISLYGIFQYENNSSIAWNSNFLGEPCFPHGPKSIFVSGAARIGRNCVIFQQVTIGSNLLLDSKGMGAPVIGDNCYIGAGAKIVGGVTIGNGVRIGANSVVYKDVPDNSIVVSGQQIIITRGEPLDNRFFSFRGEWMYFDESRWVAVTEEAVLRKLSGG